MRLFHEECRDHRREGRGDSAQPDWSREVPAIDPAMGEVIVVLIRKDGSR